MSRYEKNYARWYLRSNIRHILILCIVLALIPILTYVLTNVNERDLDSHVPYSISVFLYAGVSACLAIGVPIYQFRFLMQKRSTDLFYAMPIKKGRFFILQFILGLGIVLILPTISYVVAVLSNQSVAPYRVECLFMIVICSGLTFALYSIATYISVKCNNLWDAFIVNLGYIVAPLMVYVGITDLVQSAVNLQLYSAVGGVEEIIQEDVILSLLSIPTSFIFFCSGICEGIYNEMMNKASLWTTFMEADGINLGYVLYWVTLGCLLMLLAYRAYKRRPQEDSEQRTTAKQCYPFLIILVICSLLFLCKMTYENIEFVSVVNLLIVLIIYWTMVSFARRKIQITKGMVLSFLSMCLMTYGLSFLFVESNGFGKIQELPNQESISGVSVELHLYVDAMKLPKESKKYEEYKDIPLDNLIMNNVEQITVIEEAFAQHKEIVEVFQNDTLNQGSGEYLFGIDYAMQDGKRIRRAYYIDDACFKRLLPQIYEWIDEGLFDASLKDSYVYYQLQSDQNLG